MLKKLEILLNNEIDPAFAKRAAYIFEGVEKKRPQKILDVGCGRGFYVNALTAYPFIKEIHGVDANPVYVKKAQNNATDKRLNVQNAVIEKLPFKDNYFDAIICSEVLEHLKDDRKGLLELKRVLKPDGVLLISVPHYNFPFFWDPLNWLLMELFSTHINKDIWWLAGIWADHIRLYKKDEFVELIKKSDLVIDDIKPILRYSIPFTHFILYGIGKNIVEGLGVKAFDRFDFKEKKFATTVARIFRAPSMLEQGENLDTAYVNIAVRLSKNNKKSR